MPVNILNRLIYSVFTPAPTDEIGLTPEGALMGHRPLYRVQDVAECNQVGQPKTGASPRHGNVRIERGQAGPLHQQAEGRSVRLLEKQVVPATGRRPVRQEERLARPWMEGVGNANLAIVCMARCLQR